MLYFIDMYNDMLIYSVINNFLYCTNGIICYSYERIRSNLNKMSPIKYRTHNVKKNN